MLVDLDAAQQRWRDSGPLPPESLRLLLGWREANLACQSADMIFAAFVRNLPPEQQSALAGLMELVDSREVCRWFN